MKNVLPITAKILKVDQDPPHENIQQTRHEYQNVPEFKTKLRLIGNIRRNQAWFCVGVYDIYFIVQSNLGSTFINFGFFPCPMALYYRHLHKTKLGSSKGNLI